MSSPSLLTRSIAALFLPPLFFLLPHTHTHTHTHTHVLLPHVSLRRYYPPTSSYTITRPGGETAVYSYPVRPQPSYPTMPTPGSRALPGPDPAAGQLPPIGFRTT